MGASELRRERAVELAFEGHRFVDLRRWMLLTERPYTLKKAVFFDRDPKGVDYDNPQDAHVLNIREEILFERKFQDRHYWLPFLRDDVRELWPEPRLELTTGQYKLKHSFTIRKR